MYVSVRVCAREEREVQSRMFTFAIPYAFWENLVISLSVCPPHNPEQPLPWLIIQCLLLVPWNVSVLGTLGDMIKVLEFLSLK